MKAIVASDLHLTNDPLHEYRFGLFSFLRKKIKKYNPDALFILGDLTDHKDKHPSVLVNRIVRELVDTASLCPIYLLKGNHDYLEKTNPFFLFANDLKSEHEIFYISDVTKTMIGGKRILFLPHTRNPELEWPSLNLARNYSYLFLHQTLEGAKSSSGQKMEGASYKIFKNHPALILSGDIHVPQKIGNVTYVGSPYHINFGDSFKPRCLLIEGKKLTSLRYKTVSFKTMSIDNINQITEKNIQAGGYVKIRLQVAPTDAMDWGVLKTEAYERARKLGAKHIQIEYVSTSQTRSEIEYEGPNTTTDPAQVFDSYCKNNDIGDNLKDLGKRLLDSA